MTDYERKKIIYQKIKNGESINGLVSSMSRSELFRMCLSSKNIKLFLVLKDKLSIFDIIINLPKNKWLHNSIIYDIIKNKVLMVKSSVSRNQYRENYYLPMYREIHRQGGSKRIIDLIK